jgi:hypothetical protein
VFDFYYNLIHSRLLYVLEYLSYITGVDLATLAVALPTEALRRTNNFRMVTATATPTMETKD